MTTVSAEHGNIVDLIKQTLNELSYERLIPEKENDIRDKVVEKFNQGKRRKYRACKECHGRSDLVIEMSKNNISAYEFKKYLNPQEPIRPSEISAIKSDLEKLCKLREEFPHYKTFFVLITSKQMLDDATKEDLASMLNVENNVRQAFTIKCLSRQVRVSQRKNVMENNFCILSWEIYNN